MPEHSAESLDAFAEREARILDAAAALIQRWGYRKTTIEDVAREAGVGKGTIYLHWKTREDLFIALLLRERLRAASQAQQQLASDPEGASLHTAVKHFTLALLNAPLLRAAIQQDNTIWSELLRTRFVLADTAERMAAGRGGLAQLREHGLVRADDRLEDQAFMLGAITTGFMVVNSYLPQAEQLPPETLVNLLAEVVRRTFSAPTPNEGQHTGVGASTQGASAMFAALFEQARTLSRKHVE
jgi:AcrR family transcriptional regulator